MILVEEYNANWPKWFQELYAEIWPSIQKFATALEHVGSTSVPGLAAKPVIDMDVIIENTNNLPAIIDALLKLGYEHRGNLGIKGREAFSSPNHKIKHHLYVCLNECIALKNHLALRDHLRISEESREKYATLKRRLASEFSDSIDDYVEGKTQFIISIISKHGMSENDLASIADANKAPSRKIHIFGASGCGITTLGMGLSEALKIPVFDADNYYWKKTTPPFTTKNSIADRHQLLLTDLEGRREWIITGAMDSWAEPFEKQFDAAIFIFVPSELRIKRLKKRELERYGEKILTGGEMEKTHQEFIEWAAQYDSGIMTGRSLERHENWIKTLTCPIIRIDGSEEKETILRQAISRLEEREINNVGIR